MRHAADRMEELESSLAAVTEQRDEWKSKYIQQNKDLGCEMMDPNGTIWDYAKKLQTELAAAREEIDMMGIRYAAAEMHHANNMQEVTEQRDEAIIKYTGEANEFERQRNHAIAKCEDARRERDEAREQRDRLAEECAKIRDVAERAINYLDQSYRDGFSDEVSELRYELAAVKGGNHES